MSVRHQSLDSIMREVCVTVPFAESSTNFDSTRPRAGSKDLTASNSVCCGNDTGSSRNPIVLDDDHDIVTTSDPSLTGPMRSAPNQDFVRDLKRKDRSDANASFTLNNLSLSMNGPVLLRKILACGIPPDACVPS